MELALSASFQRLSRSVLAPDGWDICQWNEGSEAQDAGSLLILHFTYELVLVNKSYIAPNQRARYRSLQEVGVEGFKKNGCRDVNGRPAEWSGTDSPTKDFKI